VHEVGRVHGQLQGGERAGRVSDDVDAAPAEVFSELGGGGGVTSHRQRCVISR
jgi:hypothetical protein